MALTDRYRTAADLPDVIPLFPLRGVILLPRFELPLNVFEPRYLAMVEDAMSGGRMLGVIQPDQAAEAVESPAGKAVGLKRIGGAGRITTYQELPDGRLRIVLTGVARFGIVRELATDKPYRVVEPDYGPYGTDLAPDGSAGAVDRAALLGVLRSYLDVRRLQADWSAIERAPLEPLINSLSAMSPFGPEEKQALLEAGDLKARAEVLTTLAEMTIAAGGQSGGGALN